VKTSYDGKLIVIAVMNFNYKKRQQAQERTMLMFDKDGKFLWKRNDFGIVRGGLGGITSFSFTVDSKYLYVLSSKGTVDLLDAWTGKRVWRSSGGNTIESGFTSEGNLITSPTPEGGKCVMVYKLDNGEVSRVPEVHRAIPIRANEIEPSSFILIDKERKKIQRAEV